MLNLKSKEFWRSFLPQHYDKTIDFGMLILVNNCIIGLALLFYFLRNVLGLYFKLMPWLFFIAIYFLLAAGEMVAFKKLNRWRENQIISKKFWRTWLPLDEQGRIDFFILFMQINGLIFCPFIFSIFFALIVFDFALTYAIVLVLCLIGCLIYNKLKNRLRDALI